MGADAAAGKERLEEADGVAELLQRDPHRVALVLGQGREAAAGLEHRPVALTQHPFGQQADRFGEPFGLLRSAVAPGAVRSEEHPYELHPLMRTSCAVFCLTKKKEL